MSEQGADIGWKKPKGAIKYHYFAGRYSMCFNWKSNCELEDHIKPLIFSEKCFNCVRKLKAYPEYGG